LSVSTGIYLDSIKKGLVGSKINDYEINVALKVVEIFSMILKTRQIIMTDQSIKLT